MMKKKYFFFRQIGWNFFLLYNVRTYFPVYSFERNYLTVIWAPRFIKVILLMILNYGMGCML